MDEQGLHGGPHLDEFEELDRLTEGLKHLPRLLGIPEPDGGPAGALGHVRLNAVEVGQGAQRVGESNVIAPEDDFLLARPTGLAEGIRLAGKDDVAPVEEHHAVAQALHAGHVMGREQDGRARFGQ